MEIMTKENPFLRNNLVGIYLELSVSEEYDLAGCEMVLQRLYHIEEGILSWKSI